MEPPDQNDEYGFFFDALDAFPIHDGIVTDQPAHSTSTSTLSDPSPDTSSHVSEIRRRSISRGGFQGSPADSSLISSDAVAIDDPVTKSREKRIKLYLDLKGNGKNLDGAEPTRSILDRVEQRRVDYSAVGGVGEEEKEESTVTTANEDRVGDSIDSVGELNESTSLFVFVAGLVIKAIGFQLNLFFYFITCPFWILYCFYMLVVDPLGAIRRGRGFIARKLVSLWNLVGGFVASYIDDWLKEHKTILSLLMQFGWGLFWSCYVGVILCGLLVLSVMLSGFLMRYLVEEPIQIRQDLNFDYTENSPVAFVPLQSCAAAACGVECKENFGNLKSSKTRVIPPNHKLQVSVLLTLPESEYNRKLGVFQELFTFLAWPITRRSSLGTESRNKKVELISITVIRADFLSADGKTLASKSHPSILKFKSEPIRILLTFLKVAPLLAGYVSESQTLALKIKGFTERDMPTSCLKVIIEQRAEYGPGAGIPEIYDASMVLESELPLLKRIIWCWRKTIFIWTGMVLFMMELLFALICCWSVIIPRARLRDDPAINNSTPNNAPAQS
ncbi:hypothetical protein SADUNF_Sadunf11G0047400 [Salix dunnii]|uniref:Seipin n=1 Tax=Salix dunnii TaxID=1413687 RepID=A0A835MWU7_9ROSI|nr:hypothetical protein SADUNF_Sadunf11G0047400 [Salix dunnii]